MCDDDDGDVPQTIVYLLFLTIMAWNGFSNQEHYYYNSKVAEAVRAAMQTECDCAFCLFLLTPTTTTIALVCNTFSLQRLIHAKTAGWTCKLWKICTHSSTKHSYVSTSATSCHADTQPHHTCLLHQNSRNILVSDI